MLKRCCCFNLRMGSIWIAAIRLISWLFILTGSTYLCWQLFIMGHRGMVQYTVMVNLEENVYVLALIILLSLLGVILEVLLVIGVLQAHRGGYIRAWFWLTGFSVFASILMAISFLIYNIGSISSGANWFEDALCSLAHIVFFFIPEFFLGPRQEPVLRAMLIIAHFLVPILHGLSFYVVYSFYKCRHRYHRNQHSESAAGGHHGYASAPSNPDSNGRRSVTPMIQDQVIPYKPKLCQKCAHHQSENGTYKYTENGAVYTNRCHEPLLEEAPIETTC